MSHPSDYLDLPRESNRELEHIPGDNGKWPLLGDTFEFLRDYHGLGERKFRKYGPIFRSSALLQRNVSLIGPEGNEFVLKDEHKIFSSKMAWDPILDRLFPDGLMLRDFDEHRFHRKILQAAFKKDSIQGYLDVMNPKLTEGVESFPKGETFGFKDSIKVLLLDTAAQVFMGVEMGKEADAINKGFLHAMEASMAWFKIPLPGTKWRRGLQGRKVLEDFIHKTIDQKRATESHDFFSQFCHAKDEDGNLLSDEAVRDHIIFLLFAAHDTTTSTLCSMIYLLAKNQDWQDKLRAEFKATGKDVLSYDDLQSLELTALAMKESLRMYPPVPAIPRRCIADTEIMGYRIPKNTGVGISPLMTHYLEEWWTEPYTFDPLRFSKERAEHKRHFYQYIPFGGGHHKCLGLNFAEVQVKLFLFQLLKDNRISVAEGYEMQYNSVPIQFPTDGLPIRIDPLN